jgi:hypothetical protein
VVLACTAVSASAITHLCSQLSPLQLPCCVQSLQWVYGLTNVPCNIVNLSDEHNDRVVYAAAHTAVIYDKRTRKQTFLQVTSCTPAVSKQSCSCQG